MEGLLQEETVFVALCPVCELLIGPQLTSIRISQIFLELESVLVNYSRSDKSVVCKGSINRLLEGQIIANIP